MKSQAKRSRAISCLASSCSTRFSPTSSMPAAASVSMSSGATYLIAASSSTAPGSRPERRAASAMARAGGREVLADDLELDGHGPSSRDTR